MNDTTGQAAEIQASIHRRLGGTARLELAFHMSLIARELALLRLRTQYPDWSEHRLHAELVRFGSLASGQVEPFT